MRGNAKAEEMVKLRAADPAAFARTVHAAMRLAGGDVPHAALTLSVARRTLYHWLSVTCPACQGARFHGGAVCEACVGYGRIAPEGAREAAGYYRTNAQVPA